MTATPFRSANLLRSEIRRAARNRRRAASALRHADGYGDAVISAALHARVRLAAMRCEMLQRLALAQSVAWRERMS